MVRNRWTPSVGTGGGRHLPDRAVVINRYAHALIRLLREHGGKIVARQRVIGRTLGVSAMHINRVLAKLSQAASYLLMRLGAAQPYGWLLLAPRSIASASALPKAAEELSIAANGRDVSRRWSIHYWSVCPQSVDARIRGRFVRSRRIRSQTSQGWRHDADQTNPGSARK
jgi:hypothetical protein